MLNAYFVLGVSASSEKEVVAAAYKALLKKHHPDLAANESDRISREARCKELGEAFAILGDARSRLALDNYLDSKTKSKVSAGPAYESHNTNSSKKTDKSQERVRRDYSAVSGPSWDDLSLRKKILLTRNAKSSSEQKDYKKRLKANRDRVGRWPAAWFFLNGAERQSGSRASSKGLMIVASIGLVFGVLSYMLRVWAPFSQASTSVGMGIIPESIPAISFNPVVLILASLILALLFAVSWSYFYKLVSTRVGGVRRFGFVFSLVAVISLFAEYLLLLIWSVVVVIFAAWLIWKILGRLLS